MAANVVHGIGPSMWCSSYNEVPGLERCESQYFLNKNAEVDLNIRQDNMISRSKKTSLACCLPLAPVTYFLQEVTCFSRRRW